MSRCEQRAKVGIGRHNYAPLFLGAQKDLLVARCLKVIFANMNGVVPSGT